ncbi:hypothetical protein C8J56DRAFT_879590 [Mycena floridula]|nr:hypothetical protein C8J56DRAFT_879590 [Mycena floridula]
MREQREPGAEAEFAPPNLLERKRTTQTRKESRKVARAPDAPSALNANANARKPVKATRFVEPGPPPSITQWLEGKLTEPERAGYSDYVHRMGDKSRQNYELVAHWRFIVDFYNEFVNKNQGQLVDARMIFDVLGIGKTKWRESQRAIDIIDAQVANPDVLARLALIREKPQGQASLCKFLREYAQNN